MWALLVFAFTFAAALSVIGAGIDLSQVTFSTPLPVIVGVGILLTGYAPTFAALAVAGLHPDGGGVRALLRPVLRWRVSPHGDVAARARPSAPFLAAAAVEAVPWGQLRPSR